MQVPLDKVGGNRERRFRIVCIRCSRCNMFTEHCVEDHSQKLALLEKMLDETCRVPPKQHYICDICGFCDDCEAF